MFEITGTLFEHGILALRLEKPAPRLLQPFVKLGAIRGRLLALGFLLLASILTFKHQPMNWALDHGYLSDQKTAALLQMGVSYTLAGIGTFIYLLVFFVRTEVLELEFDRSEKCLRFMHTPRMAKLTVRQGMTDFKSIEKIEVFSKDKTPLTSYGYVKLVLKSHSKPYKEIMFRLLSDEQFSIYPANLMKMTGITPVGDFTDPDDALA